MATPRKTRGEYRPIYEALFTGNDYRQLSSDAKLALLTLKGLCGVMGIKVWPAFNESVAELTGMPTSRARRALVELITSEWIEYDEGVVWVVRGLMFEPQMTSKNPDHCKRLRDLAAGLPSSPVVARFKARYAEYFGDSTPASATASPPASATPSPTPLPYPSLTPSPSPSPPLSVVVGQPGDDQRPTAADKQLLTIAANAGLDRRYANRNPLVSTSGHVHAFAVAILDAGVDVEFAAATIFTYASTMAKDEPPNSLRYFTRHVIERWQQDRARLDAAGYVPGGQPVTEAPELNQLRTFGIRYAQEGDAGWQAYCDERGYPWREAAA